MAANKMENGLYSTKTNRSVAGPEQSMPLRISAKFVLEYNQVRDLHKIEKNDQTNIFELHPYDKTKLPLALLPGGLNTVNSMHAAGSHCWFFSFM